VATVSRPMVVIQTADNQVRMLSFMRDKHLALGTFTLPIDEEAFFTATQKARLTPTVFKQRLVFDGKTAERFRAVFGQLML
jgi:UDP-2,4-diacetamido-2,4,6-trideoxy-beta-L-altropyranose hydrolase